MYYVTSYWAQLILAQNYWGFLDQETRGPEVRAIFGPFYIQK